MKFRYSEENASLINRLERMVSSGKIAHAYIFEGPEFVDKRGFAESFVKGILCPDRRGNGCGACGICDKIDHGNHEDIIYIKASGSSVKDADITGMQDSLKSKPFGERHVVIIENSDTMTARAQNRLLKTLEEPPGASVIILLSENMESLAQTIRSRCVKYRINHFGSEGYDFMMERATDIAEMVLEKKPFYQLAEQIDALTGSSEDAAGFLDSLQVVFRNMLVKDEKSISRYRRDDIISNIYAVEAARRQIREGVSRSYAIKDLLIKIGG